VIIEIELDGERRQVVLRREGDRWIAEIDGRTLDVNVVEAGGRWSMLVGPPAASARSERRRAKEGGHYSNPAEAGLHEGSLPDSVASGFSRKSYEISFEPTVAGELTIHVNGVPIPLTIVSGPGVPKPVAKAVRRGGGDRGAGSGQRTIVAPMPGRIVRVLVKPHERVSARQPLVVVEAMKMENELRAPRGGTVAEVRVSEGASVEANAVLVVLE
jgi:biotin carboxyl carrier protein